MKDIIESENGIELKSEGGDKIRALFRGEGRNRHLSIKLIEITKGLSNIPVKVAIKGINKTRLFTIESDVDLAGIEDSEVMEIFIYQ
jgi:hypothetical protein